MSVGNDERRVEDGRRREEEGGREGERRRWKEQWVVEIRGVGREGC